MSVNEAKDYLKITEGGNDLEIEEELQDRLDGLEEEFTASLQSLYNDFNFDLPMEEVLRRVRRSVLFGTKTLIETNILKEKA